MPGTVPSRSSGVSVGSGLQLGAAARRDQSNRPPSTETEVRPSVPTGTSPARVMRCTTRSKSRWLRRMDSGGGVRSPGCPRRRCCRLPAEAHGVGRLGDLVVQSSLEDGVALDGGEADDRAGEAGVDEDRLLAGLGVHPDDGVDRAYGLASKASVSCGESTAGDPRSARCVDASWSRRRSRGGPWTGPRRPHQVGPVGVAPVRRHDHAPQDRAERRVVHERHVRVPAGIGVLAELARGPRRRSPPAARCSANAL